MVFEIIKIYKHPLARVYLVLLMIAGAIQFSAPRYLVDTFEYIRAIDWYFHADTIKIDPDFRGHWMYPIRRTIVFPVVLFFFKIRGIVFLQFFISLLTPFYLYRALNSPSINLKFFWLFWITFPLQFFYTALPMPEILAQFGLVVWIYSMLKRLQYPLIFSTIFLIFLKPIFIILLVPLAIISGVEFSLNRKISWIFLTFIPILLIVVNAQMNQTKWKFWGISSIATTNAYDYNRYLLIKQIHGESGADSIYHSESRILNEFSELDPKKGDFFKTKVRESILKNPLTYAYIHFKGAFTMFIDPGRYDAMVFFNWEKKQGFLKVKSQSNGAQNGRPWFEWLYIILGASWNLIKFLFLIGAFVYFIKNVKSTSLSLRLIWLILMMYSFAIGPVGTARYLIPLYPVMLFLICSAFSIDRKNENFIAK